MMNVIHSKECRDLKGRKDFGTKNEREKNQSRKSEEIGTDEVERERRQVMQKLTGLGVRSLNFSCIMKKSLKRS